MRLKKMSRVLPYVFVIILMFFEVGLALAVNSEPGEETAVFSLLEPSFAVGGFSGGSGTSQDPYLISNLNDLQALSNSENAAIWNSYFKQTADIDALSNPTFPIGNMVTPFIGSYDGQGYSIHNVSINHPDERSIGFFGRAENATIKNLTIHGVATGKNEVGGLVGHLSGDDSFIENVHTDVTVTATKDIEAEWTEAGGLVGTMVGGTIYQCSAQGTVTGSGRTLGGLVGFLRSSKITASYASGDVSTTSINQGSVGGLVGTMDNGRSLADLPLIEDSYATGRVSAKGNTVLPGAGGLVGRVRDTQSRVNHSYATGAVDTDGGETGGLVGHNANTTHSNITDSFWDTQSSGISTSAGGTGKTTAEMQQESSFSGAGWQFPNSWRIDETDIGPANGGYPSLAWQGMKYYVAARDTIDAGLLAYWSFDDDLSADVGGTDYDFIGDGNTSTPVQGQFAGRNAVSFQRSDDQYLLTANAYRKILESGNSFTYMAWYYLTQPIENDRYFVMETNISHPLSYGLRLEGSMAKGQVFTYGDDFYINNEAEGYGASHGQWHNIIVTYDAGSKTHTAHINGQAGGEMIKEITLDLEGLVMGSYRDHNARFWEGYIDETAIWNRVLTAEEISGLQTSQVVGAKTYTVSYDGNGHTSGSAPVDSSIYEEGTTVTVLGNPGDLQKEGNYSFAGWNTRADGNGTAYAQGDTFIREPADVILYAQWEYTGAVGEFRVGNYGTGLDKSYRWYRGYVFEVTETTEITALIGGGDGGTFGAGIYEIVRETIDGEEKIKPRVLLGSVALTGTEPEQVVTFNDVVTLHPGTEYLIASGRQSNGGDTTSNGGLGPLGYVTDNIEISDLEADSSRIKVGTWFPGEPNKAVQFGKFDVAPDQILEIAHSLTDDLPMLGFQYKTNSELPVVTTLDPVLTSDSVTFKGELAVTGGAVTNLYFEWGTEVNLSNFEAKGSTWEATTYEHLLGGTVEPTYYYRAVAINEAGRVEGDIKRVNIPYDITYNLDGGINTDHAPTSYTVETDTIDLGTPTKTGYIFDGWFDAASGGTKVTQIEKGSTGNMELWARWTSNTDTAYQVAHYQQDVTGDGYTLSHTDHLAGTAGTTVAAEAKSYTGFTENTEHRDRVESGTISADGSLVLKLYYDRTLHEVTFNSNGGSTVNDQAVVYGGYATEPAIPSRTGYSFQGWYQDSGFTQPWNFLTDPVIEDVTLHARWRSLSSGSDQGSDDTVTSPPEPEPVAETSSVEIIINGEGFHAAKESLIDLQGQRVVVLVIDSLQMFEYIENMSRDEQGSNEMFMQSGLSGDALKVQLAGDVVKKLEEEGFDVSIKVDDVEYRLKAMDLGIDQIMEMMEIDEEELSSVVIEISISKVDDGEISQSLMNLEAAGYQLVSGPVRFSIRAERTDVQGEITEVNVTRFSHYTDRIFQMPGDLDPNQITTGVVFLGDGTVSHVPTTVFENEGVWYASIHSRSNSVYGVVWNPVAVDAVEGHWSESDVNEMAARLLMETDHYVPDAGVSRGELATYMVKALGLYRETIDTLETAGLFVDVAENHPERKGIILASQWGLIDGYPDGTFKPDHTISREEAMVLYGHAMKLIQLEEKAGNAKEFRDLHEVPAWAHEGVQEVLQAEIFVGRANGLLAPKDSLTYSEALVSIRNLLLSGKLINQ